VYYLQAYQIHLEKWDNRIQIFLAITSSSSIGGWVVWNEYGIIWGALIAASQVINAIKRFLPFQKRAKQIGSLNTEVEKLALGAESQWFSVFEGKLTDEDIFSLVTELKQQKLEASHKHFKDQALPIKSKYELEAAERTRAYFETYIRASTTGES
ncbi:MAG: hypothetical protein OXI23_04205, partial [Gemmatimonadota bacterium]|nr:hypothetical protein [Gemmatimonadota bacterium]